MKAFLFGLFIIGGWTVAIGAFGFIGWMLMILILRLPLWAAIGIFPLTGFVVGVLHFRSIIRSA